MQGSVAVAMKVGAAYALIAVTRERLVTRAGYTFTKAEIDRMIEDFNEALINLARAADMLESPNAR